MIISRKPKKLKIEAEIFHVNKNGKVSLFTLRVTFWYNFEAKQNETILKEIWIVAHFLFPAFLVQI